MELTELIFEDGKLVGLKGKPVSAEPRGEPILVEVHPDGFPDFSERVKRYAQAMAPAEANAYVIGRHGVETQVSEKADIYGNSIKWKMRKVIASPVQFYKI